MTSEESIKKYIRERIKRAREEKGLSQGELGEVIGKTKVTISDMERGKVNVSAVDLALIAKKLGKPLNYFFPRLARIRIPKGELNTNETELIEAYRKFDNFELEDLILNFVVGLANQSRKGELRKMFDDTKKMVDIARAKD